MSTPESIRHDAAEAARFDAEYDAYLDYVAAHEAFDPTVSLPSFETWRKTQPVAPVVQPDLGTEDFDLDDIAF
jgi:hypothetical protein